MALKLPIGVDNFKEVIARGFTYVDKTLLIEEVLDQSAKVQLITRPRRFGKTLNMSMLAHFFDKRANGKHLFRDLAIEKRPCFVQQGSYPVIFLSFKDLKASSFEGFIDMYRELIRGILRGHLYLLDQLGKFDKQVFEALMGGDANEAQLSGALSQLTLWLQEFHGKGVMLLLDEYDSPIHEGYDGGYYPEVIGFMRRVLGKALKGNDALEKAVLTGILRVAKESIFSDLNNVKVFSLLERPFADKFGFTEAETVSLIEQAGLSAEMDAVRHWYNGYQIGDSVIYNPWSVINYLDDARAGCKPYWVNTSANLLVRSQLLAASTDIQDTLKSLLNGSVVETDVDEQTVFADLEHNEKTLWSFLLFCGYLTVRSQSRDDGRVSYALAIPNREVMLMFQDMIQFFVRSQIGDTKTRILLASLIEGDSERFGEILAELVVAILSYYDTGGKTPERVYHMFVLGLLAHLRNRYTIRSNREAGIGRYDVMMLPRNPADRGIIMEFKAAADPEQMDACLDAALAQIEQRKYAQDLQDAGVTLYSEIAVACHGKQVAVRARHLSH